MLHMYFDFNLQVPSIPDRYYVSHYIAWSRLITQHMNYVHVASTTCTYIIGGEKRQKYFEKCFLHY